MGFRPEPTIYNLTFEGTFLDGLHVRASCCTVSEYNEMIRSSISTPLNISDASSPDDILQAAKEIARRAEEVSRNNDRVLELFANHLVSWDLEDMAGQPVPATREGIDSQERAIINQLIQAWQVALVSVPNQLKSESSDGSTSVDPSLGLGSSSQSL